MGMHVVLRFAILAAMTTSQLKQLEATLWQSADNLRANSDLKSNEYALPVLGLIFLKFADNKYGRDLPSEDDYLLNLPEKTAIAKEIKAAMKRLSLIALSSWLTT